MMVHTTKKALRPLVIIALFSVSKVDAGGGGGGGGVLFIIEQNFVIHCTLTSYTHILKKKQTNQEAYLPICPKPKAGQNL